MMDFETLVAKIVLNKEKIIDVRKRIQMYSDSIDRNFQPLITQLMSIEGFMSYLEKEFKIMYRESEKIERESGTGKEKESVGNTNE